ncbi:MAG: hypothetical protein J6A75_13580 [Lachnospiraceae bacterium]|nr:hypothetical protein [Lachnospiraceae bacterium]
MWGRIIFLIVWFFFLIVVGPFIKNEKVIKGVNIATFIIGIGFMIWLGIDITNI